MSLSTLKAAVALAAVLTAPAAMQPSIAATRGGCAAARAALKSAAPCVENPHGIALADTSADTNFIAQAAKAGEARFRRHFGRAPGKYAVVMSSQPIDRSALTALGYNNYLSWATDEQYRQAAEASLRAAIQQMTNQRGLSQEESNRILSDALERERQRNPVASHRRAAPAIIPHELGHRWLTEAFWRDHPQQPRGHYGGPAPDWLDETAAVLMEDDQGAEEKRTRFRQAYTGTATDPVTGSISRTQLENLSSFLTMAHPMAGAPGVSAPSGGRAEVRVVVRSAGDGGAGPASQGPGYYLLARMFADYMLEKSRRTDVFGDLAGWINQGKSFEQWLALQQGSRGLPGSIAALEADWRAWLRTKFGSAS